MLPRRYATSLSRARSRCEQDEAFERLSSQVGQLSGGLSRLLAHAGLAPVVADDDSGAAARRANRRASR